MKIDLDVNIEDIKKEFCEICNSELIYFTEQTATFETRIVNNKIEYLIYTKNDVESNLIICLKDENHDVGNLNVYSRLLNFKV